MGVTSSRFPVGAPPAGRGGEVTSVERLEVDGPVSVLRGAGAGWSAAKVGSAGEATSEERSVAAGLVGLRSTVDAAAGRGAVSGTRGRSCILRCMLGDAVGVEAAVVELEFVVGVLGGERARRKPKTSSRWLGRMTVAFDEGVTLVFGPRVGWSGAKEMERLDSSSALLGLSRTPGPPINVLALHSRTSGARSASSISAACPGGLRGVYGGPYR